MTANKNTLTGLFQQGDVPSGADFANLIDSQVNVAETSVQSMLGALNPTELITPRVSAATIVATGTITANGDVNGDSFVGQGVAVTSASTDSLVVDTIRGRYSNSITVSGDTTFLSEVGCSALTQAVGSVSASGTTLGTAATLLYTINIGTGIVDGNATGFLLPSSIGGGRVQYIYNGNASANLWPCQGGQINALSSGAAFSLAANTPYTIIHIRSSGYAVK